MADVTLHTGLRYRIDSENYKDVKSKYNTNSGNLNILELSKDGRYVSTGK